MNSKLDLYDPRFALHDPNAYPRYATALRFGGFVDVVGVFESEPNGPLMQIENDGKINPFPYAYKLDTYIATSPFIERCSGLVIAAMLHERTARKN